MHNIQAETTRTRISVTTETKQQLNHSKANKKEKTGQNESHTKDNNKPVT